MHTRPNRVSPNVLGTFERVLTLAFAAAGFFVLLSGRYDSNVHAQVFALVTLEAARRLGLRV